MYLNVTGNVAATCTITSKPAYMEECGVKRQEATYCYAKCRECSPEGTLTVTVKLLFFENMAIPAMKIAPGQTLFVLGRERAQEKTNWGKIRLEHTLIVDYWDFREIDPAGMLEELKQRREIDTRQKEFRTMFAEFLTEAKPSIIKWVMDAAREMRKENTKKEGNSS